MQLIISIVATFGAFWIVARLYQRIGAYPVIGIITIIAAIAIAMVNPY
jgi:hypothetical protein